MWNVGIPKSILQRRKQAYRGAGPRGSQDWACMLPTPELTAAALSCAPPMPCAHLCGVKAAAVLFTPLWLRLWAHIRHRAQHEARPPPAGSPWRLAGQCLREVPATSTCSSTQLQNSYCQPQRAVSSLAQSHPMSCSLCPHRPNSHHSMVYLRPGLLLPLSAS